MENTTNLKLPLLIPNQSGKEITHNEALVIIDNLLNNGVIDKDLKIPPEGPNQNDLYIVGLGASGEWAGKDNQLAYFDNGWRFAIPRKGTKYWVNDEASIYVFNGTSWTKFTGDVGSGSSGEGSGASILSELGDVAITSPSNGDILKFHDGNFINSRELNSLDGIGVNCEFDSNNRFAVKSDYVLFDNNGDSSRIKVNKALTENTASHLFQSNYSGRAEFGLIGDDNFTLKVSDDGETWNNAFVVDKSTGNIDFKGEITKNGNNLISPSSSGECNLELVQESIIQSGTTETIIENLNDGYQHKIIFENITTNLSSRVALILGNSIENIFYNNSNTYMYNIRQRIATNNSYYSSISNSSSCILFSYDAQTVINSTQSYIEIITNRFTKDNKKFIYAKWYSSDAHFRINEIDATTINNIDVDSMKLYLPDGAYFANGLIKHYKIK